MLRLARSVALIGFLVALASPGRAVACSPFPACPYALGTLPRDGATAVPTNVWIRIEATASGRCDASGCDGIAMRLREQGGAEVELDVVISTLSPSWLHSARPRTPLAPRTTYELLETSGPCRAAGEHVLATFTTGDGDDDVAPPSPTLRSAFCRADACDEPSCCGPYSGTYIDVLADPGTDAGSPPEDLRFEIGSSSDTVRLASAPTSLRFLRGVPAAGFGGWTWWEPSVRIRTVDLAGNTSEPLEIALECPIQPPDAATDGGGPVSAPVTGCACRVGRTASMPIAPSMALALALAARARRRRRI